MATFNVNQLDRYASWLSGLTLTNNVTTYKIRMKSLNTSGVLISEMTPGSSAATYRVNKVFSSANGIAWDSGPDRMGQSDTITYTNPQCIHAENGGVLPGSFTVNNASGFWHPGTHTLTINNPTSDGMVRINGSERFAVSDNGSHDHITIASLPSYVDLGTTLSLELTVESGYSLPNTASVVFKNGSSTISVSCTILNNTLQIVNIEREIQAINMTAVRKLSAPTNVSVSSDNIITWTQPENATSYTIYLDTDSYTLVGNVSSYNLTSLTSWSAFYNAASPGTHDVKIKAHASGYESSDFSVITSASQFSIYAINSSSATYTHCNPASDNPTKILQNTDFTLKYIGNNPSCYFSTMASDYNISNITISSITTSTSGELKTALVNCLGSSLSTTVMVNRIKGYAQPCYITTSGIHCTISGAPASVLWHEACSMVLAFDSGYQYEPGDCVITLTHGGTELEYTTTYDSQSNTLTIDAGQIEQDITVTVTASPAAPSYNLYVGNIINISKATFRNQDVSILLANSSGQNVTTTTELNWTPTNVKDIYFLMVIDGTYAPTITGGQMSSGGLVTTWTGADIRGEASADSPWNLSGSSGHSNVVINGYTYHVYAYYAGTWNVGADIITVNLTR